MIITEAGGLRLLGKKIFIGLGVPEDKADFVSETLVEANLCGHDSHGVSYFATYGDRIKKGYIKPHMDPKVIKETQGTANVDGQWGFGQIVAMRMMEIAVRKSRDNMISAVGAYNVNHIGRLGFYTEWATKQGVIALMFANVGNPIVAGFHGTGRTFGTNPISISTPTATGEAFLMDYATSLAAAGKLSVARAKKAKIPLSWTKDKNGNPTDDPNAYSEGGWMMGFGEHKGYGLQMVSELLGAALTGSRISMEGNKEPPSPNGVFCMAINPDAFVGLDVFKNKATEIIQSVKSRPPEQGETVLVHGDPERISKKERLTNGIPIPETTWELISTLCQELNIDPKIALKH